MNSAEKEYSQVTEYDPMDKIRDAVYADRPRASLVDVLQELGDPAGDWAVTRDQLSTRLEAAEEAVSELESRRDELQEALDAYGSLLNVVDEVSGLVEEWRDAERGEKADLREQLMDVLENLVQTADDLPDEPEPLGDPGFTGEELEALNAAVIYLADEDDPLESALESAKEKLGVLLEEKTYNLARYNP